MVLDLHSSEQNFRHGDTQDIIRKAENLSYEVIQWNISRNARNAGGICLHTCIINTEILIRFGFAIVVILKILLEREHIPHKQLIREVEQVTERLSNKNPCNDCKVDRQIGNPNRWECECSRCDKPNDWKNECVKKLAEYENAEDEGRLVVLPCDTVYFICDKGTRDAHVRTKSILDLLVYDINGIDKDGRYWSVKEEAEKTLKEMKKNE